MINYHSQRQFIDGRVLDYEFKCRMQGRRGRRARAWSSEIRSEHRKPTDQPGNGMRLQMAETHDRGLTYVSQSPHTIRSVTSAKNATSWGQSLKYKSLWDAFLIKPPHSRQGMIGLGWRQKTLQKKKNELGTETRGTEGFHSCWWYPSLSHSVFLTFKGNGRWSQKKGKYGRKIPQKHNLFNLCFCPAHATQRREIAARCLLVSCHGDGSHVTSVMMHHCRNLQT